MITREARRTRSKESIHPVEFSKNRSLALFTESIVALLSSPSIHAAIVDLVSLMGQTFPLAAPSIYMSMSGSRGQAYSVLDRNQEGPQDAMRVLGKHPFTYIPVPVGGHPPIILDRVDICLIDTLGTKVILSINSGIHDGIFREWVNLLTPVVGKLLDHEVLLQMAYRDGLTGLLNYRAFDEMMRSEQDRAMRYRTAFSVMMIDVDWFKKINDTYGHQIGDAVLKSLANGLEQCVRKSDRVFRYGGEEFAIILPHTELLMARKLAERIRYIVEKTDFIAGLHITVSIGISEYRDGLASLDIVKQADKGLYLAKKNGRNRVEVMKGAS